MDTVSNESNLLLCNKMRALEAFSISCLCQCHFLPNQIHSYSRDLHSPNLHILPIRCKRKLCSPNKMSGTSPRSTSVSRPKRLSAFTSVRALFPFLRRGPFSFSLSLYPRFDADVIVACSLTWAPLFGIFKPEAFVQCKGFLLQGSY